MNVVLVTGGFDPIHSGHIQYFLKAKELGDILVVGLNSDAWLTRKKGRAFMPWTERCKIIKELKPVGYVTEFNDDDGSACNAIKMVREMFPVANIIFANGGDRNKENIPEMEYKDDKLSFVFGVGGSDKMNSSSWILDEWKSPKTERPWGYYRVLHDVDGCKVKELTVNPGKSLSKQRHFKRSEYWMVTEGMCTVDLEMESGYKLPPVLLTRHENFDILHKHWHQLSNPFDVPCKLVEIQYGEACEEEDIERVL
jgi:cytidyltransferase-like protein